MLIYALFFSNVVNCVFSCFWDSLTFHSMLIVNVTSLCMVDVHFKCYHQHFDCKLFVFIWKLFRSYDISYFKPNLIDFSVIWKISGKFIGFLTEFLWIQIMSEFPANTGNAWIFHENGKCLTFPWMRKTQMISKSSQWKKNLETKWREKKDIKKWLSLRKKSLRINRYVKNIRGNLLTSNIYTI